MSKARQLADLGNVYDDGALSNRNLIINGSFRVSQRGDYTSATSITHNAYMLDRWKMATGVSSTIQDLGGYVEIKATASSGASTIRISQLIEDLYLLEGQTVTVSCEMKSNSSNGRLAMHNGSWVATSAVHTGGGEWEKLSFTTTMPSSLTVTSIQVGIDGASSADVSISSGDYCQIKNVQLEVGDTATPFEHRSYGDELARCQRYYHQTTSYGTSSSAVSLTEVFYHSYAKGASQWEHNTSTFPATMRATPTVVTSDAAGAKSKITHFTSVGGGTSDNKTPYTLYATRDGFKCSEYNTGSIYGFSYEYSADAEL